MSVPESIRRVPRPRNTVVIDSGHDGALRYAVRARAGVKYNSDGKSLPVNGKVIGHIYNNTFVSCEEITSTASSGPEDLSYGAAAFVESVSEDLFKDLCTVFPLQDACDLMATAMVRATDPGTKCRRIASEYGRNYIRRFHPDCYLSANRLVKLFTEVGEDGAKRRAFYEIRMKRVEAEHHVVIDGTLKQDTSYVNSQSAYSFKARLKGCKDVSVIYAYDLEKMEPICAELFAGNRIDACAFATFIRERNINKGIIVVDKGFPPSKLQSELRSSPQLHYLIPIKRSDARIQNNDMLKFDNILTGIDQQISYRKQQIKGGRFLYTFKDFSKAAKERHDFVERMKSDPTVTYEKFEKHEPLFGVIVFESDQDLDPLTAYLCYEDRWQIECVFDSYKNDENFDCTNVQGDFSLWGSEFVNFIATVLTYRMKRKAQRAGLLNDRSYKDLLKDLATAWRKSQAPLPAKSDDRYWMSDYPGVFALMEALGLSIPGVNSKKTHLVTAQGIVVPGKRGRPRTKPEFVGPKRPRGRPKKLP